MKAALCSFIRVLFLVANHQRLVVGHIDGSFVHGSQKTYRNRSWLLLLLLLLLLLVIMRLRKTTTVWKALWGLQPRKRQYMICIKLWDVMLVDLSLELKSLASKIKDIYLLLNLNITRNVRFQVTIVFFFAPIWVGFGVVFIGRWS